MLSLRRLSSRVLKKTGLLCVALSRRVYRPPQDEIQEAFNTNIYEVGWLDHDLDENSLVLDVGGYRGQWTSDIFAMYCCSIHIFEPIAEFADSIAKRFSRNNKIIVHRFGLSNENRKAEISCERDESSVFKHGTMTQEILLVNASEFLEQQGIRGVDLIKINIEGGEYDLLEHLIEAGFIAQIRSILVQFHDFVPQAEKRMQNIQKQLAKTHYLAYQYRFVWEKWKRKDNSSKEQA